MKILSGKTFAAMVQNGFKDIKIRYEKINALNVFPVPDGDTGTNIAATLNGGIKAMEKADVSMISDVAAALAHGMLYGARGNSGVIVSQFFSGMADGLQGLKSANKTQFASALRAGTNKAYKAVKEPVEGTILTVAREGSTYVLDHLNAISTFEDLFQMLLERMNEALANTPNLLPVLREAGVIDSGGAGLVAIMEGMYKYILGEELEDTDFVGPAAAVATDETVPFDVDSHLDYGYCTEFIMQLLNEKDGPKNFVLDDFVKYLESIGGDSIVALIDGTVVKVHVHTMTPGLVIGEAQKYGEFVTFKMENMSIQHQEKLLKEMPIESSKKRAKAAIVAVTPSEKIAELFTSMGVAKCILGGQTMNPSAQDFTKAFDEVNAETILVFPNNGNVILTAKQAAELYKGSRIEVINSKSAIECYSCLGLFDLEGQSIEENLASANEAISHVVSAQVSTAVRDSVNNGLQINEGDFIGICKGAVVNSEKTLLDSAKALIKGIEDIDDRSVITVFYGADVTEEEKAAFREFVESDFELMDLVEVEGGQKIYPMIFAIE